MAQAVAVPFVLKEERAMRRRADSPSSVANQSSLIRNILLKMEMFHKYIIPGRGCCWSRALV